MSKKRKLQTGPKNEKEAQILRAFMGTPLEMDPYAYPPAQEVLKGVSRCSAYFLAGTFATQTSKGLLTFETDELTPQDREDRAAHLRSICRILYRSTPEIRNRARKDKTEAYPGELMSRIIEAECTRPWVLSKDERAFLRGVLHCESPGDPLAVVIARKLGIF